MILTVCVFSFLSLTGPAADSETCYRATSKDLSDIRVACSALDRDPISTCEVQQVGATKFFVRIRHIETHSDTVTRAKEEV